MASTVSFFAPADPLNINTLLSLTGDAMWIQQTNAPAKSADRAQGLKANGDEAAWRAHNVKGSGSVVYKCFLASGFLTLPKAGIVANTNHIDSVKLGYDPVGWPTLTVAYHKHLGATTHLATGDKVCNSFATTLAFPACFSIPAVLKDLTTPTAVTQFEITSAAVGMKSLEYTLSCTHQDENAGGDWLAGDNRDGVEQIDAETTGVPDDADVDVDATWHNATDSQSEGNTTANSRKLSYSRHVARAT